MKTKKKVTYRFEYSDKTIMYKAFKNYLEAEHFAHNEGDHLINYREVPTLGKPRAYQR